uniref:hypothetical protein n=1 Tax=Yersinia vastinensis TaxID=2890318 RepID=UPI001C955D52
ILYSLFTPVTHYNGLRAHNNQNKLHALKHKNDVFNKTHLLNITYLIFLTIFYRKRADYT